MARLLTEAQLIAISDIERACSVLSLLASLFVVVTFSLSKSFHKPVNRLVFYATFGNMLTNVGTLMSRSFLGSPLSPGCQLQAFLIQMFMPADAFWTLAMAINVYLTFYYKFDAARLRRMEIPYLVGCYGIPFIPAIVYLFLEDADGNRVYGDATIWCWVTPQWNVSRIVTFYGPVWLVILITFFIYIRAGRTIYEKRKQINNFHNSSERSVNGERDAEGTIKTTEVTVTTSDAYPSESSGVPLHSVSHPSQSGSYAVSVAAHKVFHPTSQDPRPTAYPEQPRRNQPSTARRRTYEANNAAWAYTKCAILFFTALLITWIPSSANRVYSFIHAPNTLPPLEIMSAFVLPLQGFWNAIIYTVTSRAACRSFLSDMRLGRRPSVNELVGGMRGDRDDAAAVSHFRSSRRANKDGESESMTGFAGESASDERSIQTCRAEQTGDLRAV